MVFRKKDLFLIITQKLTFMKSGRFKVKSCGFCVDFTWNPPDFVWISPEIHWILYRFHLLKSARFHMDFTWNLPDFTCWNLLDFVWISPAEIRQILKYQLPGMVSPMFLNLNTMLNYGTLILLYSTPCTVSIISLQAQPSFHHHSHIIHFKTPEKSGTIFYFQHFLMVWVFFGNICMAYST